MYATVADLRAEGLALEQASDERVLVAITEASAQIDRVTGWFFDPRDATYVLNGKGTSWIDLPVPLIRIDRLLVSDQALPLGEEHLIIVGIPVAPRFEGPELILRRGRFTKGTGTVTVVGRWGYTEPDGTADGRTPLAIRRACMLLVMRLVAPLAHESSFEARSRWRILEERTRDQSYRLAPVQPLRPLTGDPDVDALLTHYLRPRPFGAV